MTMQSDLERPAWKVAAEARLEQIEQEERERTLARREGRKRGKLSDGLREKLRNCNPMQLRTAIRLCRTFLRDHQFPPADFECTQRFAQTVLVNITVGNRRYRLESRACGKRCKKCPHGPYLYAYQRDGRVIRAEYLGKPPFKQGRRPPRKVLAAIRSLHTSASGVLRA